MQSKYVRNEKKFYGMPGKFLVLGEKQRCVANEEKMSDGILEKNQ